MALPVMKPKKQKALTVNNGREFLGLPGADYAWLPGSFPRLRPSIFFRTMYLKKTTTRAGGKTYEYVKVCQGEAGAVIATLGTLSEVLQSIDTLISGLQELKNTGQSSNPARVRIAALSHQVKTGQRKPAIFRTAPASSWKPSLGKIAGKMQVGKFASEPHRTKSPKVYAEIASGRKTVNRTKTAADLRGIILKAPEAFCERWDGCDSVGHTSSACYSSRGYKQKLCWLNRRKRA